MAALVDASTEAPHPPAGYGWRRREYTRGEAALKTDPLSYERIREARQTLTAAAHYLWKYGGGAAIEQSDPDGVFIEAKRNLTALTGRVHGHDAWERMLEED